jgi:hypothetical protein
MVVWSENIGEMLKQEFGADAWNTLCDASKNKQGVHDVGDIFKCESYIQSLMADLWDGQKKSQNLEKLSEKLIVFAKQNGTGSVVAFAPVVEAAEPAAAASVEGDPGKTEAA